MPLFDPKTETEASVSEHQSMNQTSPMKTSKNVDTGPTPPVLQLYRLPPGSMRWPRAKPQRLQLSDLTTWMLKAGISRDGLADATRAPLNGEAP